MFNFANVNQRSITIPKPFLCARNQQEKVAMWRFSPPIGICRMDLDIHTLPTPISLLIIPKIKYINTMRIGGFT